MDIVVSFLKILKVYLIIRENVTMLIRGYSFETHMYIISITRIYELYNIDLNIQCLWRRIKAANSYN